MENERDRLAYSATDFCKWAAISRPTFYRWSRLPDFPKIRVGAKIIVPKREAEAWLSKHIGQTLPSGGADGRPGD